MKVLIVLLMLTSLNAFACWRMEATLSVNEDKVTINQKIDHDKTYSFGSGNHLFHVKVPSKFNPPEHMKDVKDAHMVEIGSQEKKGVTLSPLSKGMIFVQEGKEASMVKQNNETKDVITFIVKLTKI